MREFKKKVLQNGGRFKKETKKRKLNFTMIEINVLTGKVQICSSVKVNKCNNKSKKEQNLTKHD